MQQAYTKQTQRGARKGGCARVFKVFLALFLIAGLLVLLGTYGAEMWVRSSTQADIETVDEAIQTEEAFDAQCIVVLGAGINFNGTPSTILKDRLDTAIALYKGGVAPKIIMSGDNTQSSYNEVMAMTNYAKSQGVPAADIFCDHAGVNTYDSMHRLKTVFSVKRCIVATQQYHLYRALYNAKGLGIDARGVAADAHEYANMDEYEAREFLARIKDFYQVITKPNPNKLSEPVSLDQSGEVTQWW